MAALTTKWDPTVEPWRVVRTFYAPPPTRWRTQVFTFATEAEARVEYEQPLGRAVDVRITYAENAATWTRNGRWRQIAERRRT
jgi:hypothetical protein